MRRQRIFAILFIILTFALSTGIVFAQEAAEAAEEGGLRGIGLLFLLIGLVAIVGVGAAIYFTDNSSDTPQS